MVQFSVTFDLSLSADSKELPMSLMLARGYTRAMAVKCFQKLQELDCGTFDPGSPGRSKIAKFIPNDKFPLEYTMTFEKKKPGRPKKVREVEEETVVQ